MPRPSHPHPNRLAWRHLSSVFRAVRHGYSPGLAMELAADAVRTTRPNQADFAERAALMLPRAYGHPTIASTKEPAL